LRTLRPQNADDPLELSAAEDEQRSRHSRRTLPTQRSMCAIRGAQTRSCLRNRGIAAFAADIEFAHPTAGRRLSTGRQRHDQSGRTHFSAVRRSASFSQLFTDRITSSRAGTPVGKSVCRRPSRFTVGGRTRAPPRRAVRPVGADPALLPRRRVLVLADAPTTPCARRRCAPRAAARANVLPHSGHLNAADARDEVVLGVRLARVLVARLAPVLGARAARVFVDVFLGLAILRPSFGE